MLGFGCNLLGASVNHAFCHSVHEGAPVYEKVIESLAAVLFILPVCLCTLVIFKCIWSGTALCRKYSLYPIKRVCAVLALKVLQNLKQFLKYECFLLWMIFEYTLSGVLPTLGSAARKHKIETLYKMEGRYAFTFACLSLQRERRIADLAFLFLQLL